MLHFEKEVCAPEKKDDKKKKKKQKKKKPKCKIVRWTRTDFDIVLAVAHVTAPTAFEHIVFRRSEAPMTRRRVAKGEFAVSWEKFSGCNTAFEITRPPGYVLLALRRPIGEGKGHRDVVYTPYTKEIDTVEMRRAGYNYSYDKFEHALKSLRTLSVRSQAFRKELVPDVVPIDVAVRLGLIEHIDPYRVQRGESMVQLTSEALVITAANREHAYTCSMSKKGAYGWLQFIPRTYRSIVRQYPEAVLIPDFRAGMNDHPNAAAATLLLFDSDWSQAPPQYRRWLRENPDELERYLAVMYNSGKAAKLIAQYGERWIEHLLPETRMYVHKLAEVRKVLGN